MDNENFNIIISKLDELKLQQKEILKSEKALNSKEASNYLGISPSQLYKLTHKNKITFSKPNGKLMYFKKIDLDKFMLQNTIKSVSDAEKQVNDYLKR